MINLYFMSFQFLYFYDDFLYKLCKSFQVTQELDFVFTVFMGFCKTTFSIYAVT